MASHLHHCHSPLNQQTFLSDVTLGLNLQQEHLQISSQHISCLGHLLLGPNKGDFLITLFLTFFFPVSDIRIKIKKKETLLCLMGYGLVDKCWDNDSSLFNLWVQSLRWVEQKLTVKNSIVANSFVRAQSPSGVNIDFYVFTVFPWEFICKLWLLIIILVQWYSCNMASAFLFSIILFWLFAYKLRNRHTYTATSRWFTKYKMLVEGSSGGLWETAFQAPNPLNT